MARVDHTSPSSHRTLPNTAPPASQVDERVPLGGVPQPIPRPPLPLLPRRTLSEQDREQLAQAIAASLVEAGDGSSSSVAAASTAIQCRQCGAQVPAENMGLHELRCRARAPTPPAIVTPVVLPAAPISLTRPRLLRHLPRLRFDRRRQPRRSCALSAVRMGPASLHPVVMRRAPSVRWAGCARLWATSSSRYCRA